MFGGFRHLPPFLSPFWGATPQTPTVRASCDPAWAFTALTSIWAPLVPLGFAFGARLGFAFGGCLGLRPSHRVLGFAFGPRLASSPPRLLASSPPRLRLLGVASWLCLGWGLGVSAWGWGWVREFLCWDGGVRLVAGGGHPFVVGQAGERGGGRLCFGGSASLGVGSVRWGRPFGGSRNAWGVTTISLVAAGSWCGVIDLRGAVGGLPGVTARTTVRSTIQPTTHPDGRTAGQKSQRRPSTGHRPLRAAGRRRDVLICVPSRANWYARQVPKNAASGRGRLEDATVSGEG